MLYLFKSIRKSHIDNIVDEAIATKIIIEKPDEILENAAAKAANELTDQLVYSPNESTRRQSAIEILDRSGYGRQTKTQSQSVSAVVNIDAEQIGTIRETLSMLEKHKDKSE